MRDDTKHATEVEIASRKLVQAASEVDVGIHLSEQEVLTDPFSNNEANTQDIERVEIGSNNICFPEDLAKEKMVFSKESIRVVFENGQCGAYWVEEIIDSMPIMRTPRFWRNTSLQLR